MFEIGASLAAARQARGLDLRAAEALTCMRAKYLAALEEEHFEQLPGRTYARAFLRTYAAALGLEADRFVAEFDEQVPDEEPIELAAPPRRRHRSLRTPLILAAAAALGGIIFWSGWNSSSTMPSAVATPKARHARPVAHAVRRPVKKQAIAPALLVVRARGACWVQLRRGDANGAVLAERTLEAGDVLRVKLTKVWLRLGAPWNVTVRRGATLVRNLPRGVPVNLYWTSAPGHVSESR